MDYFKFWAAGTGQDSALFVTGRNRLLAESTTVCLATNGADSPAPVRFQWHGKPKWLDTLAEALVGISLNANVEPVYVKTEEPEHRSGFPPVYCDHNGLSRHGLLSGYKKAPPGQIEGSTERGICEIDH